MHAQGSKTLLAGLQVVYTEKKVSPWGGLAVVAEYFQKLDLRALLGRILPDGRTSPNAGPVEDMAMSLMATVLTGGQRFAHVERCRDDGVIKELFKIAKIPSPSAITRYFGGFRRAHVEPLREVLKRFTLEQLTCPEDGEILDIDSTVFDRFGEQEGSRKGYNARRPGRPSHHPVLAMLASSKTIPHAWLRSGDASPMRGAVEFLEEALNNLPEHFRIRAVRADSGFFADSFLSALERRGLQYAIAVRIRRDLQNLIRRIGEWTPGRGCEYGEILLPISHGRPPRRLVVVRRRERGHPRPGKHLFLIPGYSFNVIATNMHLRPEEVVSLYNGRADSENRIKELKHDFAAAGFCLQSFFGTEAVFLLICFLFNLAAILFERLYNHAARRLCTVRTRLFAIGALLGRSARQLQLRLAVPARLRHSFAILLAKLADAHFLTASQFFETLPDQLLEPARAWSPRNGVQQKQLPFTHS